MSRGIDYQWKNGGPAPSSELRSMLDQAGEALGDVVKEVRQYGALEHYVIVIAREFAASSMTVGAVHRDKIAGRPFLTPTQRKWLERPCEPGAVLVFFFGETGGGAMEIVLIDTMEN